MVSAVRYAVSGQRRHWRSSGAPIMRKGAISGSVNGFLCMIGAVQLGRREREVSDSNVKVRADEVPFAITWSQPPEVSSRRSGVPDGGVVVVVTRPAPEEELMYALLVTADVEPGHEAEGLEYLRAMLPDLQQTPGLLSGHWLATTTDGESLAVVMFEDEAAAKQMAEIGLPNAPQPPGAKFRGAEVREVVAQI